MYGVSLGTLMTRVRQVANLEGATAFVTDPELIANINQSVAEFYDMVRLTTFGGQHYRAVWPVTTALGTSVYALAPNTADVISVDAYTGGPGNIPISCRPYSEEMRNVYAWVPYGPFNPYGPLFYQIQGDNISFIPNFPSGIAVNVNYTPTAPVLSNPDDVLNSWNGWEAFVIYDAAVQLALKDGQYNLVPLLQQRADAQRERIMWAASQRDKTHADPIHDYSLENAGLGFGFGGWSF